MSTSNNDRPEALVVGAGSAGAVVARRLLDAGLAVTVLEAGPSDEAEAIHDPLQSVHLLGSEFDWNFRTVPQTSANGVELLQPRGRTLGGTSSLNGMIYARGVPSDYDAWVLQGAAGWTWSEVEPYFRKLEDYDGGAVGGRGVGGPLHIQRLPDPSPIVRAFVEAAEEAGYPYNDDYNDDSGLSDGVSYLQTTIRDGRRVSSWEAYVRPVADNPRLSVVTGATVIRILVEGGRATGVEYLRGGELHQVRSDRVVLSAGVFGTPQILQLSGIGDAAQLRSLGIDVQVHVPGVGRNLQDHVTSPVIFETAEPVFPKTQGLEAGVFGRTRPGLLAPNVQPMLMSFVYPFISGRLPEYGFTITGQVLHPLSRGTVSLRSADPTVAPLIDPRYISEPDDLEVLVDCLLKIREIGEQPALQSLHKGEVHPGPDFGTRERVREYVRRATVTGQHQVGTARMGVDSESVVDPTLRVHGVEGLWVADASIMPTLVSGNTNGPTIMIGERAADFVLGARSTA
ncbi:choline dehydrogenase [Streptomyces sp. NRRL B-1140]|uniref:GMC family oxidoreductase n=1 Tax=Streptomyces sp. NRRL B-1140 TaxID=1415549 RepID=UPI0006AF8F55|nr:GMC family oxidoreductase N-terminal domain-containing protein [Streptomyces sp. NRRL B-1140]KOV97276.1 choline dehydrogenase [Streptomyces sp. NRRL B-1140]